MPEDVRRQRSRRIAALATWLLALAGPVSAQQVEPTALPPDEGGQILSMGQPPIYKWYGGLTAGSYAHRTQGQTTRTFASYLETSVFTDIGTPVASILGLAMEAYIGARDGGAVSSDVLDGGIRALAVSPYLNLSIGTDFNIRDERADLLLRFKFPVKRGGFLVRGGQLQLNYLPTRGHSWQVGLQVPIGQPWAGKTRPRNAHHVIPTPPEPPVDFATTPALEEALAHVSESARWINRYTSPFIDQGAFHRRTALEKFEASIRELDDHMDLTGPLYPEGRTPDAEIHAYHAELERAFSIVLSGRELPLGESTPAGRSVAAQSRKILLDETIFPYNRLLGQKKKRDTALLFVERALASFSRWLAESSDVAADRREGARYVFKRLGDIVEDNRAFARESWGDSRLAWIPLHYGLRKEDHDERTELDFIISRAVGAEWTVGNQVWYVQNTQFQMELAESISRAENYHVLWIHDIASFNAAGNPDLVTFAQMVRRYLGSLIRGVREYDDRGAMPIYLIMFDQHYYELKQSRLWMNVLEDPLHETFPFPKGTEWAPLAAELDSVQAELRAAVADSRLLQERARQFGQDWLKNRVKVHVNITQPADPNFWSNQVFPLAGYPDNIMRDHRKIAFYDITEDDPYRGVAIYSGMGIGEHYIGPTWEDRAIMAQGPAVLHLKDMARQLLLDQGFSPEEIPYPLKPKPLAENWKEVVQERAYTPGHWGRALELHNETGYAPKPINVIKAVLYTLMPPGSVIILPDSLWNSSFFASLLFGSAMRGANVFIIAPSIENAPGGEGFPQMSRAQELFARLIRIQDLFGEEIARSGGMLKTGLYDVDIDVADMPGGSQLVADGLRAQEWLREAIPFDESVYEILDEPEAVLGDYNVEYLIEDTKIRKPQLHLKVNFFATPEAWRTLVSLPQLSEVLGAWARETGAMEQDRQSYSDIRDVVAAVRETTRHILPEYLGSLSAEQLERWAAYLIVGSANQDYRSMFMDGESAFITSGLHSMQGLFDMVFLVASATWVDTLEELEALLPEQSGFKWQIGRLIREAL
jgi:hypothetical protein